MGNFFRWLVGLRLLRVAAVPILALMAREWPITSTSGSSPRTVSVSVGEGWDHRGELHLGENELIGGKKMQLTPK